MSSKSELQLHIDDLWDILADITLDGLAHVESIWYELWDTILNYWVRHSSNLSTRLSVAPQQEITREILSDNTEAGEGMYAAPYGGNCCQWPGDSIAAN